ncbi:MAG: hypothetical protein H7Z42_09215 [Roseiflexaceae bacterium]|nr:hypothetical protein [Roseiflexaceae bacterium]
MSGKRFLSIFALALLLGSPTRPNDQSNPPGFPPQPLRPGFGKPIHDCLHSQPVCSPFPSPLEDVQQVQWSS